MSNKIYALGETVYDIIFKNVKPVSACPGGSVLNSAVSLGRCGLPVYFISEIGMDLPGKSTLHLLKSNNVNTDYIYSFDDGKTKLALAFLNDVNNAEYDFYNQYSHNRLDIKMPDFSPDDILLFGSYFSIDSQIRTTIVKILNKAKESGCLVVYDPNFRKAHLNELTKLKSSISENIEYADIIRASNEDIKLIFDIEEPKDVYSILNNKNKILVYTQGKNDVILFRNKQSEIFHVPDIHPISTIAAGDSFNAGIIYSLFNLGIKRNDLHQLADNDWDKIINTGIDFAIDVCLSYDNYISTEFMNKLKS
ncbi:MAG: carbohydrate kinase [Ignavibacteriae bacterium]|nr:carbohydrate kinase [Ignavibacteriota bacterium]